MSWAKDLDLLGTRRSTSPLSWMALLVAVPAVIAMTLHREELLDQQAAAQARLDAAVHLLRTQSLRAEVLKRQTDSRPGGSALVDLKALESATALVHQLAHPWAAVFGGVEEAARGIAILDLRHDSDSAAVDIEAAVPDDSAAWHFVEALGADDTHFTEAELLSQQPLTPAADGLTLRIQIRAVLRLPDGQVESGRAK